MFRSYYAIVDEPGKSMPKDLSDSYSPYHLVPSFLSSIFGARSYACKSAKLFENRIATLERNGFKVERKTSFIKKEEEEIRADSRAVLTWFR